MASFRERVETKEAGIPLREFLVRRLSGWSKRRVKRALEAGACRVNGAIECFATRRLARGEMVDFAAEAEVGSSRLELGAGAVLYEDDHCFVIDKPAGFVCTPEPGGRFIGDAVVALRAGEKSHLVHRLDRDTSGALLFCKRQRELDRFFRVFRERRALKAYEAIVDGAVKTDRMRLRDRIGRISGPGEPARHGRSRSGHEAVTELRRLASLGAVSLLRLFPKTGRTHQLRVQLALIGHPVIGDMVYGRGCLSGLRPGRQMLHARGLVFPHPFGGRVEVEAPRPDDFRRTLEQAGG